MIESMEERLSEVWKGKQGEAVQPAVGRAVKRAVKGGKTDTAIADELGVSPRTVKRIRKTMGVGRRKEYDLDDRTVKQAAKDGTSARQLARDLEIPYHVVLRRYVALGLTGGRGRPYGGGKGRSVPVQFRASPEERDQLHAEAARAGVSLSDYIRSKCLPDELPPER